MKPKILCVLHRSPPIHGAAKIGDFIASSEKLDKDFECQFISIRSSIDIGDIGRISFKKIYLALELYIKILFSLVLFRPNIIYFTASVRSVAFYRDLFVSTLWKIYRIFKSVKIYYHYHTKGINEFVCSSDLNLRLTNFFVDKVNIVLLSPSLSGDFNKLSTFSSIQFLPNGVENALSEVEFENVIHKRFSEKKYLNFLYLSNMIKSKGYFDLLELASLTKNQNIHYHFAGAWQNEQDEKEFFNFIEKHNLSEKVTFHGFVDGNQKRKLLEIANLFCFPTRYPNEAFPLSVLEALSYGVPVVSTDEGFIPYILDEQSGIVLRREDNLFDVLSDAKSLVNKHTSMYCRQRFLAKFCLEQFEDNVVELFKN